MNRPEMIKYLELLNEELAKNNHHAEIVLAGGAVMLLVIQNREMTKDIDAYFGDGSEHVRKALKKVAINEGLPDDWLNDGVKGFFYGTPPQEQFASLSHLDIYTVDPRYMIAMKAVAARAQDVHDLKALIHYVGLKKASDVLALIETYIPPQLLKPQVQYLIEAIFENLAEDNP